MKLEEALVETIREVAKDVVDEHGNPDADDIEGLADFVQEQIQEHKRDLNTDDIEGLEDFVDERIDQHTKHYLHTKSYEKEENTAEVCENFLNENFHLLLYRAMQDSIAVKGTLEKIVKAAVTEIFSEAMKRLMAVNL
jgi:hypothetical protein